VYFGVRVMRARKKGIQKNMFSIPLGKVSVPTPGTPVPITLSGVQQAELGPTGRVAKMEIWVDPADTGTVSVKQGGVTMAVLPVSASGHVERWESPYRLGGLGTNPTAYTVDAFVANNGPFVTLWVE
jgi:hypothetical protein